MAPADLFEAVLDGRPSSLTGGVHAAVGRAPTDLAGYAKSAAAGQSWD
jgi:hypothetical protein